MGAVKNLFVRIGGDASGAVNSFRTASSAGSNAKESIKKSSAETKKAIRDGFSSPVQSIRNYTATVSKTREAHQVAVQSVSVLSDKVAQLEDVYGNIKNATDGLDLSKSLADQISTTEKSLEDINVKIVKTQNAINRIGNPTSSSKAERLAKLQEELQELIAQSDETGAHLSALDDAARRVGTENIGHASAAGLKILRTEIDSTRNQLATTKIVVQETDQKLRSLRLGPTLISGLKSLGFSALQSARSGVAKLGEKLKGLARNAARGIVSLPGKLLSIGKSAASGCGGLSKMARSIRNLGVVSLGLRVAGGMFGQLRSIISEYISRNEALNASVTSLKNQLGSALAPAINLVLTLLQRLMPVVNSVSNAINTILTALFGKAGAAQKEIASVTAAANAAADSLDIYGFDQITKVSDTSSNGGSGISGSAKPENSEPSAMVKKLSAWIQQLKAAFIAGDWSGVGSIIGNGIDDAINAVNAAQVGAKIGSFVNNVFTALHSTISSIDFLNLGITIGEMLNAAFSRIDWKLTASTIGAAIQSLFDTLLGFVVSTDWATVGGGIGATISGMFASIEWGKIKSLLTEGFNGILDLITGFASEFVPLQGIDFSLASDSLRELWQSLWSFVNLVGGALAEVYDTVLKPILQWAIEDVVPATVDVLTTALGALASILKPVMSGLSGLIVGLKPVIDFIKNIAMIALDGLRVIFEKVAQVFTEKGEKMHGIISGLGEIISIVWGLIEPQMMAIKEIFGTVFSYVGNVVGTAISAVLDVLGGLIDFVAGIFTADWKRAWGGIVDVFSGIGTFLKNCINTIIGFINGLISGVCTGINTIIKAMNKLKWDIPDWVPVFGGETFGFSIKTISPPKIPMLAKGAVVNEPTAAIVGEAGKEAVMPLENNTGWITKLAQQINAQGGNQTTSLALAIYFKTRKMAEYFIQDINSITKETGVCPIHL